MIFEVPVVERNINKFLLDYMKSHFKRENFTIKIKIRIKLRD
jgi:hypothetical protein